MTATRRLSDPVSADESSSPLAAPVLLSRALVAVGLLAQILVAWRFWNLTWDDSAITLGFARTFALTGKVEPTPGSGIVEGYSTTLWMLLMAGAAKFASTPSALLAVAKISTLLLNLANVFLMRAWFLTWNTEVLANLVAGSIACSFMFYETINGMETPLLFALVFVTLMLFPVRGRVAFAGYLLAGSALELVRWETAWLLVPFLLAALDLRRTRVAAAFWSAVFLLFNFIRWRYFGYLLPNTITAKDGVPYTSPTAAGELLRHLVQLAGILRSSAFILAALAACLLYRRLSLNRKVLSWERVAHSLSRSWPLRFTVLFTLFSLFLSVAIGSNHGPFLRSFYSGWPFLFCLLLLPVASNLTSPDLPWATAALCLFALLRLARNVNDMQSASAPVYMPSVTVANFRHISSNLSEIQIDSHRSRIVFAGPDMGAVILYSNGVEVVDLGMLCDPVLAQQRYAAIDSYVLQRRRPDVIEIHSDWTEIAKFERYSLFRDLYRPVYIHGMRMFLSRSLIADIDPSHLTEKPFDAAGLPDPKDVGSIYAYAPIDQALNRIFGSYLVLD